MVFPTRSETLVQLEGLASGQRTPLEVENWAERFIIDGTTRPIDTDSAVWEALQVLSGANLLIGPGKLLHSRTDFAQWLSDFRAATAN